MNTTPLLQDVQKRPAASRHVARLYKTDTELADTVARFVSDGLACGEAVLVIATAAHWAEFVARLATVEEVDLAGSIVSGQLRIMDADHALSAIMSNGTPDWHRVYETASTIIQGSHRRFGALRVYGEMVNILWQQNKRAEAEQLEMQWNALAYTFPVTRMCAYRVNEDDSMSYNELLRCVCKTHASVIPPGVQVRKDVVGVGPKFPHVVEAKQDCWC